MQNIRHRRERSDRQLALFDVWREELLLAGCLSLGADTVAGWSAAETQITGRLPAISASLIEELASGIALGRDPLGDLFATLRSPATRRTLGATYTPLPIVKAMLDWAEAQGMPDRVVDPGVGSGRFLVEAGRRFPRAALVGVEVDPVAALMARAHLAAAGMAERASICLADYCTLELPPVEGRTLFIGNPPYVRHHLLRPEAKAWLTREADRLGRQASQLAGLHVHFLLATVLKARPGDTGAFITSAEWLDVNYGRLARDLFIHEMGGCGSW